MLLRIGEDTGTEKRTSQETSLEMVMSLAKNNSHNGVLRVADANHSNKQSNKLLQ